MTSVTTAPVIEIEQVSKTFGGTRALNSFSMDVMGGEIHALVGQNGSGKSTLVKILSGFHTVDTDSGASVKIDGQPVELDDSVASRAAGLRFVHQDLGLIDEMSAVENLALGRGYATGFGGRILWYEERRKARTSLARLGYSFDVDAPVRTLEASERTGIAVARALDELDKVRLLVIDEPTATLPQAEVSILFEVIERVRQQGIGVIYISHRLDEVFAIANRVTVLRDGSKVGTYLTSSLDTGELISLMLGRAIVKVATRVPRANAQVALEAQGLCGTIVTGADLVVRHGEILGIAGLTGSGRDELLSLLFGAAPRLGSVTVGGDDVPVGNLQAAIKAGMGFVPADRHGQGIFEGETIQFNSAITDMARHSGVMGWLSKQAERREVESWIERLDIRPNDPDAPVGTLSGGNQQKVVMSKWLRMRPGVLLLDDPTQGVDVAAKASIHRYARESADAGAGVIVASSDEEELCDICDRVLVLRDGEIVGELVGDEISQERILQLHR